MSSYQSDQPEIAKIRPYARLLTMIGEQLIKNDRIALVELIKNSYDADASEVMVDFINFEDQLTSTDLSRIAIVDNGTGMSEDIVRQHWLNPATPSKEIQKRKNPRTSLGRVVQGEKGIGRFAIFKLGSTATIITRGQDSAEELVLEYDLSFLDFKPSTGDSTPIPLSGKQVNEAESPTFIDEIEVRVTRRQPQVFNGVNSEGIGALHGTRLEVANLRSSWTENLIRRTYDDVARLQPLVPVINPPQLPKSSALNTPDFSIVFSANGNRLPFHDKANRKFQELLEERAVLRVDGSFSEERNAFHLEVNGQKSNVSLTDPAIAGLRIYRSYFGERNGDRSAHDVECGPFDFRFFVFDLTPGAPIEHRLDRDERDRVKEHRIYLYRDGIRVLPYGDAEDDWLQLDVIRGTQGASRVLSNDQIVGFVFVTQEYNPRLKDKTNREGLLESGYAYQDFVILLQLVLSYLRAGEFARYLEMQKRKREAKERLQQPVETGFQKLLAAPDLPETLQKQVKELQRAYLIERQTYQNRAHRTEDLAGVGLSVEAASHDIIATANHALRHARTLSAQIESLLPAEDALNQDADSLIESLSFVASRLQDIQGLFVSTRQRRRSLLLRDYVERVAKIYSSLLARSNTSLAITDGNPPLMVKATDAALLQVLINLFDNALYWLEAANTASPSIRVVIDSETDTLMFADNGPGVNSSDAPYIFEPFYSAKGEEGKGLGLYIARQVGARSGFTVDLVTDDGQKILPGANFRVSFGEKELDA